MVKYRKQTKGRGSMKKWIKPEIRMLQVIHTYDDSEIQLFDNEPKFNESPRFDTTPSIATGLGLAITTGPALSITLTSKSEGEMSVS